MEKTYATQLPTSSIKASLRRTDGSRCLLLMQAVLSRQWNQSQASALHCTDRFHVTSHVIACASLEHIYCFIYWTADLKSSKPWSLQLWTQLKQFRIKAWKSQDFNGIWTRDHVIPVRRSNQLSYEATDVGRWSFVSSNEPVKNGCEVICEIHTYHVA